VTTTDPSLHLTCRSDPERKKTVFEPIATIGWIASNKNALASGQFFKTGLFPATFPRVFVFFSGIPMGRKSRKLAELTNLLHSAALKTTATIAGTMT
jgi:hypothetical protein